MVLRILRAAGALGVDRVLLSTDTFGIAAGVQREMVRLTTARSTAHLRWPKIEFLELARPTGSAADTTSFARIMAEQCSAAVVLLGGDGTMRAAVPGLGETPMLALSTGTFKNQYDTAKVDLKSQAQAAKAVATGAVRSVGVGDIDSKHAVVYVAADTKVTNVSIEKDKAAGKTVQDKRYYRFQLSLTRVGDRWLLNDLEFIS